MLHCYLYFVDFFNNKSSFTPAWARCGAVLLISERDMRKIYLLNEFALFDPEEHSLVPFQAASARKITLHTPASECLRHLLLHNGQVVSQKYLFEQVWEKNGTCVTVNTLYQNIVSLRKAFKAVGFNDEVIKTLPKVGFKISVVLKEVTPEEIVQLTVIHTVTDERKRDESESDKENGVEKIIMSEPPQVSEKKFLKRLGFLAVTAVITLLWGLVYQQIPGGNSFYSNYNFVGKVNGCELYSSYSVEQRNRDLFELLNQRHPVQCQAGSVAYMTINRMYEIASIVVCNENITEDDARCESFIFRGGKGE